MISPELRPAPRLWGLSPLADQRIGGVIMWVPAHIVFIIPLTVAYFRWVRDEAAEEDAAISPKGRRPS